VLNAFVREHIGLPERNNVMLLKACDTFAIVANFGEKRGAPPTKRTARNC
jgi:hypothetical protein